MFAVCGEPPLMALAETTMADVPAGVPGLRGAELPPPQPMKQIPNPRQIIGNAIIWSEHSHRRFLVRPRTTTIPARLVNAPDGIHAAGARGMRSFAVGAAVTMVS